MYSVTYTAVLFSHQLITSVDPSILRLTKVDDEIYSRFRKVFPDMIVDVVDEDVMKNNENKVVSEFLIYLFIMHVFETSSGGSKILWNY